MATIITGTNVGGGGHPVEVWRQAGVGGPGAAAVSAQIGRRQVPTGPDGLAQVIAVIKRLDGTLGYSREAAITVQQTLPLKMTLLGIDYKVSVGQ